MTKCTIQAFINVRSRQTCPYVNDVANNRQHLDKQSVNLMTEQQGLSINSHNTVSYRNQRQDLHLSYTETNGMVFEQARGLRYLGAEMNMYNEVKQEISVRMLKGNQCYYAL